MTARNRARLYADADARGTGFLPNLRRVEELLLLPAEAHFDDVSVTPNGGFHSSALDGKPGAPKRGRGSEHRRGLAVDFSVPGRTSHELGAEIYLLRRAGFFPPSTRIIVYSKYKHVHLDLSGKKDLQANAASKSGYVRWSPPAPRPVSVAVPNQPRKVAPQVEREDPEEEADLGNPTLPTQASVEFRFTNSSEIVAYVCAHGVSP